MGCSNRLLENVLYFINILFFMAGAGLITLGTYLHIHMESYFDFLGHTGFGNTSIFIIIIGILLVFISLFGTCGICCNNACMTHIFGFLVLCLLIIEIGLVVAIYAKNEQVETAIFSSMREGMK